MSGRLGTALAGFAVVLAACSSPDGVPPASTPSTTSVASATSLPALPVPVPPPPAGSTDPERLVGSIEIPAIGLDQQVWWGVSQPTIDKGVAWWPGTAEFGQLGNVVLAGHRTELTRPFFAIGTLERGDEIVLTSDGESYTYEVTGSQIVPDDALWIVDQTYAHTLTLFSCHPLYSTEERIVVRAVLVDESGD